MVHKKLSNLFFCEQKQIDLNIGIISRFYFLSSKLFNYQKLLNLETIPMFKSTCLRPQKNKFDNFFQNKSKGESFSCNFIQSHIKSNLP